jgi:hypothetical protein
MMFLDEDDMTAVDGGIALMERGIRQQERIIAELRRLGEPTQLAEKFLLRLRDTLETRRYYRDRMLVENTDVRPNPT